ncbi:MAG: inositol monophosphatase family protein [Erysipelotrichaceae bacterium]
MDNLILMDKMVACAKLAGQLMKRKHPTIISNKTDSANIVTNVDLEVQDLIINKLLEFKPDAQILAEEGVVPSKGCRSYFIIDPIDGTTNYAYNYNHSAISIAYVENGIGKIGVCYNPYQKEMFYATIGYGAYLNKNKIQCNNHILKDSLVICGTSPYHKENAHKTFETMEAIFVNSRDIRRSGSAVLDLCYIASGKCDAFYEEVLCPWDHAAAVIIIKEAGGKIQTLNGSYSYEKPIGLVAGCPSNFKEFIELTNR